MEDWQKDFFDMLEAVTSEVENFFSEVTEEVTELVEAIGEISEEISEQVQSAFSGDLSDFENYLNALVEPVLEIYIEFNSELEEPYYPAGETGNPVENEHSACVGCSNYHGQVYGGNMFVCAMHPYGWDSENCPDWESN